MGINIRNKGAGAEREIVNALEPIVQRLLREGGFPVPDKPVIQRNQNQSAVGGSDLSNTFGMCIEVKRQEQLQINTWWAQCIAAAKTNEQPVLLYRQNGKKWRAITFVQLPMPPMSGASSFYARVEMSFDDFLRWFEEWARRMLLQGLPSP